MVAAPPGVFVNTSHVMSTTAPAAIPGRRPFSAGVHIAHGTLTRPHRDHTLEERGVERSAASLDTHGHARRSQSSARSAGPVWRARARRCARASQQLGQGIGLGALTARGSLLRVPPHGTYTRRAWRAGHGTSPRHHAGRRTGPPVPPALPASPPRVWRTSAIFRKPQRFCRFCRLDVQVAPYHPLWQQRTRWNGPGTARPTRIVCYLPYAKGGHAKHVETRQFTPPSTPPEEATDSQNQSLSMGIAGSRSS